MKPRAVLFDLDGVLLDTASAVRATLAAVATCALGRRVTATDLPHDALLRPRCAVLADLGVRDPDNACARWWDPALAGATHAGTGLFPGILPALQFLQRRGTRIGVVTLQDSHRLPWLLPPALAALIHTTVTRHDAPPKPAPDGITLALRRLATTPERAVFVGDTPGDITAARAAGVTAAAVTWGYAPTHLLQDAGAHRLLHDSRQIADLTAAPGHKTTKSR